MGFGEARDYMFEAFGVSSDYSGEKVIYRYDYYEQKKIAKDVAYDLILKHGDGVGARRITKALEAATDNVTIEEHKKIEEFVKNYVKHAIVVVSFKD